MIKKILSSFFLSALIVFTCAGTTAQATQPYASAEPAATTPTYVLVAWSELGMHCMDGKDYSVFSVLPPYNTIHAQLLQRGQPPVPITSGVTITYQAIADATGSINTHSADKTNFWDHVRTLFLNSVPPETGLAGYKTQSRTARKLIYNATEGYWEAVGIPTVPYDDTGKINAYPMVRLVAKNAAGTVIATARIVLAVSDEMSCKTCHASGTSAAAKPSAGWVNNPDPAKDVKLNILRKHDDRWPIAQYLGQLQTAGYTYQAKLYDTALSGTPVLCAACHSTNALGAAGISPIRSLTSDMHRLHGPQINPATGKTLNAATTNEAGCYLCHPGVNTKCQRGAMNTVRCSNCHGNLTKVGSTTRAGWLDVPSCQMCHNSSKRYATAFVAGKWRQTTDLTFATNPNVPLPGKSLYRFSTGHGGAFCSACHGSQHAELPSLQPNDNVYPVALQGYAAKVTECGVCHTNVALTPDGGPHGMHTIDQPWVSRHHDYAEGGGYTRCAYCHGPTYRGSPLSIAKVQRTFNTDEGVKTFPAGHPYSCYDCHNGPTGG